MGITAPQFFFIDLWRGQIDYADFFAPLHASRYSRAGHLLVVVARRTAALGAVEADAQRTFASLAAAHPDVDANLSARDGNAQVVEALRYIGEPQADGSSHLIIHGKLFKLF